MQLSGSRYITVVLAVVSFLTGNAQTKVYVSVGTNFSNHFFSDGFYLTGVGNRVFTTDNKYHNSKIGKYFNAELTVEKKLNKLIYGVTGISFSQVGYADHYATNFSTFELSNIGIPLLFRANFVNGFMLDVGPVLYAPVSAQLDEVALKGSAYQLSASGNILSYFKPVTVGFCLQLSVLINRYTLTGFLNSGKNSVDPAFRDSWGIQGSYRNNSLFQRDLMPKFSFQMTGLKVGMRLW
jgi:hypothetical protein